MGQRRDNGVGKQCGSHVDYVVHGALPHGADVVAAAPRADALAVVGDVPIRPSKYLGGALVCPGGGEDGFDDIDADSVLFPCVAGWDASVCTRTTKGTATTLPQYDSAEDYLREVPHEARKICAWYVRWCQEGSGRVKDLTPGFMRQLSPLRYEYLVLGRIADIAEKGRLARLRAEALERLMEYSADDRIPVRQSAVAAAGKVLDHLDRRDEIEAMESAGNVGNGGGGFTLSINIAAMIGGGVGNNGVSEVIDAKP